MRTMQWALSALLLTGAWLAVSPGEAVAQKRQRDVITRDEILASAQRELDIFVVVRSLRPHFLAPPRGVRSMGGAPPAATVLYVNGNKMGDLSGLKLISARDVEEVRYLDPSKAEDQFGIEHSGGAVMVTLVRATKPPAP
jgi:hypothetical protein